MILTLFKMKQMTRVVKVLLCHMLLMEAVNIAGCVTAITALLWCQVRLPLGLGLPSLAWELKLDQLSMASNIAFIIGGFLTDGILVKSVHNIIQSHV